MTDKKKREVSRDNIVVLLDKERIENVVYNSFTANRIDYKGQMISVIFSNYARIDGNSVQYNLPIIKLTESQIRTLLSRKLKYAK